MKFKNFIKEEKVGEFLVTERTFSDDNSKLSIGLANIHALVPGVEMNKNKIIKAVEVLKSKGANMIIFPEFCLAGYFWDNTPSKGYDNDKQEGDPKCWEYMETAVTDNHWDWVRDSLESQLDDKLQFIIFNNIRRGPGKRYFNSTYIINKKLDYKDPKWIYDKTFLPGIEKTYTISGETDRLIIDTKWGRLGCSSCLSGDTNIFTKEHGIIPINNLGQKDPEESEKYPLDITVSSLSGKHLKANKWMFNGKRQLLKIKSYSGYEIKCTPEHQLLIYDGTINDIIWKEAQDINHNDRICINSKPILRDTKLELNLPDIKKIPCGNKLRQIKKPKYMTPDLAFWLSLIISEGCYSKYRIDFINSSEKLIERFGNITKDIFELDIYKTLRTKKGGIIKWGNKTYTSNHNVYNITINSKVLSCWLEYLGVSKLNSWHKVVPWSVLQSDSESQLAYLAGYIEGDGTIHKTSRDIIFASRSEENLRQIQLILNSHGIMSRIGKSGGMPYLRVGREHSDNFYPMIEPWLVDKIIDNFPNGRSSTKFGIPSEGLKNELSKRKIVGQNLYICENNSKSGINTHSPRKIINYHSYEGGIYNKWLDDVNKIIPTYCNRFKEMLKEKYFLDPVEDISEDIIDDVYDISMLDNNYPAFTSNGIIVHNCYDFCFAQIYQEMAQVDKVDGVIQIASWRGSSEREYLGMGIKTENYYGELWDMLMDGTAARNQMWIISANAVGIHAISDARFWGGSGLWAPSGMKLLQAGHKDDELLLIHNVDIKGEVEFEKNDFDYTEDFDLIYKIINGKRCFTRL